MQCIEKYEIYKKMIESRQAQDSKSQCNELASGDNVKSLMKIDYKPATDCGGEVNQNDEY